MIAHMYTCGFVYGPYYYRLFIITLVIISTLFSFMLGYELGFFLECSSGAEPFTAWHFPRLQFSFVFLRYGLCSCSSLFSALVLWPLWTYFCLVSCDCCIQLYSDGHITSFSTVGEMHSYNIARFLNFQEEWKIEKFRSTCCHRLSLALFCCCWCGSVTGTSGGMEVHWLSQLTCSNHAESSLLSWNTLNHSLDLTEIALLLEFYWLTLKRVCSLWELSI